MLRLLRDLRPSAVNHANLACMFPDLNVKFKAFHPPKIFFAVGLNHEVCSG